MEKIETIVGKARENLYKTSSENEVLSPKKILSCYEEAILTTGWGNSPAPWQQFSNWGNWPNS